jgi:hypothetical protein
VKYGALLVMFIAKFIVEKRAPPSEIFNLNMCTPTSAIRVGVDYIVLPTIDRYEGIEYKKPDTKSYAESVIGLDSSSFISNIVVLDTKFNCEKKTGK